MFELPFTSCIVKFRNVWNCIVDSRVCIVFNYLRTLTNEILLSLKLKLHTHTESHFVKLLRQFVEKKCNYY